MISVFAVEILSLDVIVNYTVLEPAINGLDDNIQHGMGTESQVADFADFDLLVVFDVLEAHCYFILAYGQQVFVVGGLLSKLHDAWCIVAYGLKAEVLQPFYENGFGITVKVSIDFVASFFKFCKGWKIEHG